MDQIGDRLRDLADDVSRQIRDNREVAIGVGTVVAVFGVYRAFSASGYKKKPGSLDLSGGSIDRKKIDATFKDYSASFGTEAGAGISDRERTTELVRWQKTLLTCVL